MEMDRKNTEIINKAKPSDTVLALRYELKRPVGRGGFSIVYEAADLQLGRKVAVKECTIPTEKERFLREAKLLEEYSEEDAIVRVLDYFEENDTAYIVMEFLEGGTLRECIEQGGKWTMERTVERMAPVMETLEHLHKSNVIHRDISPDNIMVLKDGRLKLLDFGAAKQYSDSTMSRLVVKASYSPPEQMDAKGVFGSWSDVYSVCAAMYFCITGKNPEDAISRLMFDDLKKPSELGADILPAAEKALMNGMALDSSKRIRDVAQLRTELEKIYPILSEEEKAAYEKKKKLRKILKAAAVILAVAGIFAALNARNIEKFVHKQAGTETIIIDGSQMTEEEFNEYSEIVRARADAYTKGNCSFTEKGRVLDIEMPVKKVRMYADAFVAGFQDISTEGDLYVRVKHDDDSYSTITRLIPSKDIKNSYEADDRVVIELTKEAQERLEDRLGKTDTELYLYVDADPHWFSDCRLEDGKRITCTVERGYEDFVLQLLKTDPFESSFETAVIRNVSWEEDDLSGSDGSGKRMRISYELIDSDEHDGKEDGKAVKSMKEQIKRRLDLLGIKHSVGTDKYDDMIIVAEVPYGSVSYETAYMLKSMANVPVLGGVRVDPFRYMQDVGDVAMWFKWEDLSYDADKKELVYPRLNRDTELAEEIADYLGSVKEKGEKELYLYVWGVPLAKMDIDQAINDSAANKDLVFTELCVARGKEDEFGNLIGMIGAEFRNSDDTETRNDSMFAVDDIQVIDEDGFAAEVYPETDIRLVEELSFADYADELNRKYKGELEAGNYPEVNYTYMNVLYVYDRCYPDESENAYDVAKLSRFYKDNKDLIEKGSLAEWHYQFGLDAYVKIMPDNKNRTPYIHSICGYGDKRRAEQIADEIRKDEVLSPLITDETIVSDVMDDDGSLSWLSP